MWQLCCRRNSLPASESGCGRGGFALFVEEAFGNDELLFLGGDGGVQKCRKCAHKNYLLKSAAQIGRVFECFQTLDVGIAEIEVVIQHCLFGIEDGKRDVTGENTAIVAHYLRADAGCRVFVGDGDVEDVLHAVVDVVEHHINEQIGTIRAEIDVAGAGLLDAIGLGLHLAGADGLHIGSLDARDLHG
mgnify:CR=1 FL=1